MIRKFVNKGLDFSTAALKFTKYASISCAPKYIDNFKAAKFNLAINAIDFHDKLFPVIELLNKGSEDIENNIENNKELLNDLVNKGLNFSISVLNFEKLSKVACKPNDIDRFNQLCYNLCKSATDFHTQLDQVIELLEEESDSC